MIDVLASRRRIKELELELAAERFAAARYRDMLSEVRELIRAWLGEVADADGVDASREGALWSPNRDIGRRLRELHMASIGASRASGVRDGEQP